MEKYLLKIYQNHFIAKTDIRKYLKVITNEIETTFTKKQIVFFIKCNKKELDLIALEYNLRKKD